MDTSAIAKAYRRRADAREAERLARFEELRTRALRVAGALRAAFGDRVRVYLFGSLLEPLRFRLDSDIDLAVEGLSPSEYWEALALVEPDAPGARIDLVRLESASAALRDVVRSEGELLP